MSERPSLETLLRQGIAAAQQGNRQGARVLFQRVLADDKQNDRAWYWMAYISQDPAQRVQYLEAALRANPRNKMAKSALKKLRRKRQGSDQRIMWIGGLAVLGVLVLAALLVVLLLVVSN